MSDEQKLLFSDNITYLEDDGNSINVYVKFIEVSISYVKFRTMGGSIITIPMHRVLKLKERGDTKEETNGKREVRTTT